MKRVALLGMPNTGKSTLFNRLTGAHAKVGNWPGLTVELLNARLIVGDQVVRMVDLPGIYDLQGYSDDERVVTQFLDTQSPELIIFVLNTTQFDRQLTLLSQVMAKGLPMVLVLNMVDEARAMGIQVDVDALRQKLNLPIHLISAKYGQGVEHLLPAMRQALGEARALPLVCTAEAVDNAFRASVDVPTQASHATTEKIDKVLLHPVLGLPIFFAVMLLLFQGVFTIGKPLQDGATWLLGELRLAVLDPLCAPLPMVLQGLLLDGIYNGLSTVASFVPLIVLFFVLMGIVEDTGYLSRAAFLMDALMAKFGLDGRSFVMLLMGFGCNVPALMGTRVIRSKGLRYLTMLTIPFSLCSARMQVFVFLIAALFTAEQAPWVLFSLYLMSLVMAMLTSLLFKGQYVNNDAFILEMPPYRLPTARQMAWTGWQEVRHFLKRATRFIVMGVVMIWVLTHFPQGVQAGSLNSWAGQLGESLQPIFEPIGIDSQLTIALLFGFVAKEIVIGSLAVIFGQEGAALVQTLTQQITWIQAYSFMLFVLIYTPCVSTIATIRKETQSLGFTVLSVVWPLVLAWCVSWTFYKVATTWFG